MSPYHRYLLTAALTAAALYAQPTRCIPSVGVPPTRPLEGWTELAGDITLTCTGGTPAAANSPVPQSDITIYLNTYVTSRILSVSNATWLEALLMIDEPHSIANPAIPFLACGDAGAPDLPADPGVCGMTGTGTGTGVYNGTANRPNIWQGRLNGNMSITWRGIPLDAAPSGGSRIIRITNVRFAAPFVPDSGSIYLLPSAAMAVSIGGAHPVEVFTGTPEFPLFANNIPANPVAFLQPGMYPEVFYATSLQASQSHNAGIANGTDYANASADFVVRAREGFQAAFLRKNWGYSLTGQVEQNQNIPGLDYNTGTGFDNRGPSFDPNPNPPTALVYGGATLPATPGFPSYHNMSAAGLADAGFRIMLSFASIPDGVVLAVPTIVDTRSQLSGARTGMAHLVSADSQGVGGSPVPSLPGGAITGCSTNITLSGVSCPTSTGLALIEATAGTGHAVYEIYYSDAFNPEELAIPVAVGYIANPGANLPVTGLQTTVRPQLAPDSFIALASSNDPLPRFSNAIDHTMNAFTLTRSAPSYTGSLDTVSCNAITGWAADRNQPGKSITVSIYDGAALLARFVANQSRTDVATALGDNGLHGFSYPLASVLSYSSALHVFYEGTTTELPGSPKALNCLPYTGYLESASCSGFSGWAANTNTKNAPISVALWTGNTRLTIVTASSLRPDVGQAIGDNGNHGFSIPFPVAYADGTSHTFEVRYETSPARIGAPTMITCGTAPATPNYAGYVDVSSCIGITGWAADRKRPSLSIMVGLWDGATQIATVNANLPRLDVAALLIDNGVHGFSFTIPSSYSDGSTHSFQVRYETSSTAVGPAVSLTCGRSANYTGYIDGASCSGITGWAADRNRPGVGIGVNVYDGTTYLSTPGAIQSRPDVGAFLGDNGNHGFLYLLPSSLRDGRSHTLHFTYDGDPSVELPGSPKTLTCGSATYVGYIDNASCSGISGWAADRTRLYQPLTVSLWDGNTQIASMTASASRPDVGAVLFDSGLHGFTLLIPDAYKNGVPHSLEVHYETSSSAVGPPATLTCGGYAGWLDHVGCDAISGWAADRNHLDQMTFVEILLDGTSLIADAGAGLPRPDVGAVLGDAGNHGFSVANYPGLNDGKPHTVHARYLGTSQSLGNSPQPLQCPKP